MLLLAVPLTTLLVYLLVAMIALAVAYWLIITFAPEPIRKFLIAALVVIAAIVIIKLLFGFAGGEPAL